MLYPLIRRLKAQSSGKKMVLQPPLLFYCQSVELGRVVHPDTVIDMGEFGMGDSIAGRFEYGNRALRGNNKPVAVLSQPLQHISLVLIRLIKYSMQIHKSYQSAFTKSLDHIDKIGPTAGVSIFIRVESIFVLQYDSRGSNAFLCTCVDVIDGIGPRLRIMLVDNKVNGYLIRSVMTVDSRYSYVTNLACEM